MATIIREGKHFTLTEEELLAIRQEEHRQDIRYEYEEAVRLCEEEGWISFSTWDDGNHCEWDSEDDYRQGIIDYLTDSYLEAEYLYDRDPDGYRSHDFTDDVLFTAEDEGIRKE